MASSMPLAFGAILTGGYLLDRGAKDVRAGLASTPASGSTGAGAGKTGGTSAAGVPSSVPSQWRSWVATAAKATGLPASVVAAQISAESGFNPHATSSSGAEGIAQFLPSTWSGLGIPGSPYNPHAALEGYIKLMSGLISQYHGNVRDALAAYNAGPGNLAAGYGYADSILNAAGQPASLSV